MTIKSRVTFIHDQDDPAFIGPRLPETHPAYLAAKLKALFEEADKTAEALIAIGAEFLAEETIDHLGTLNSVNRAVL